jgi:hypothetical protein
MEAKRIKTFEALSAGEKKQITAVPDVDAVDSHRPVAANKVAWRAIVLDRQDRRAVKGQWWGAGDEPCVCESNPMVLCCFVCFFNTFKFSKPFLCRRVDDDYREPDISKCSFHLHLLFL